MNAWRNGQRRSSSDPARPPPLAGVEEIAPILESLQASGARRRRKTRPISPRRGRPKRSAGRSRKPSRPLLSRRREEMPGFVELLGRARRLFDADGSVRDDASPALRELRTSLRRGEARSRAGWASSSRKARFRRRRGRRPAERPLLPAGRGDLALPRARDRALTGPGRARRYSWSRWR